MLGWLKKKAERYAVDKQVDTIWKAMGVSQDLREENDRGPLRSFRVETDMTELNGFEEKVNVARTRDGIFLLKKSNGDPIPAAISLSDEDLQKIPPDIYEGVFVHLVVRAKYSGLEDKIYSCFISDDGTPYGDHRAFWWSLAKKTVSGSFLKINKTRMTDKAFAQVRAVANSMWEAAVENVGSIDQMRDTMVLLRNKHLVACSQMKQRYEGNASVTFGVDIALAMILAAQAEDRALERIAFEHLRQFIWEHGREPREFLESHEIVN